MSDPKAQVLTPAKDVAALEAQLNNEEVNLGFRVDGLGHYETSDSPPLMANFFLATPDIDADQLKRLIVTEVPATAQTDQDAFKTFIAPLLDTADLIDRAKVVLGGSVAQVVLLRKIDPPPVHALSVGQILKGDGTWPWTAQIDGNDIVVLGAKATAFGGDSDLGDNGETASGCPTKGNPGLLGCALPMDGYKVKSLAGSPLPRMPFGVKSSCQVDPSGIQVEVTHRASGKKITVPVIDLGPGKGTGHALDLTVAAARYFKSNATANNFGMVLDYRILNGKQYVAPAAAQT